MRRGAQWASADCNWASAMSTTPPGGRCMAARRVPGRRPRPTGQAPDATVRIANLSLRMLAACPTNRQRTTRLVRVQRTNPEARIRGQPTCRAD
ncbi:MAG: hypothetical protein ACK559_04410 [bacterium]